MKINIWFITGFKRIFIRIKNQITFPNDTLGTKCYFSEIQFLNIFKCYNGKKSILGDANVEILFIIIVLLLIILFFISFALFIRRLIINSSVRSGNSNNLEEKLDKLIDQNNQLLLLLKDKK